MGSSELLLVEVSGGFPGCVIVQKEVAGEVIDEVGFDDEVFVL